MYVTERNAMMVYNLTKIEQETIILFNEVENTARISTFNGALVRKLLALCDAHPDEAAGKGPDQNGECTFTVLKKRIKVNAGNILTDKQKQVLSERGKNLYKLKSTEKQQ
jgi:hypothetical protein